MGEKIKDIGKIHLGRTELDVELNHGTRQNEKYSDKDEYLHRLADFIHTLKTVERVEVLPYHTLGVFKWEQLGIPYPLEGVRPPSEERINNAREILGAI